MLVADRMSKPPITIRQDAGVEEALRLMKEEGIRRLPVVNRRGKMVGIVSEMDLLKVSPSPATSLSVYEIPYLLASIKMKDVMTRDVTTVSEDMPLEDAARIMVDNQISGLPVMRGKELVGLITETDMFKTFLEMLGGRDEGSRITLSVPNKEGMLAKITSKISNMGVNIISLSTITGEEPGMGLVTLRLDKSADLEELTAAMEDIEMEIRDARICKLADS